MLLGRLQVLQMLQLLHLVALSQTPLILQILLPIIMACQLFVALFAINRSVPVLRSKRLMFTLQKLVVVLLIGYVGIEQAERAVIDARIVKKS